jgi:hypothetical protein
MSPNRSALCVALCVRLAELGPSCRPTAPPAPVAELGAIGTARSGSPLGGPGSPYA